MDIRGSLFKADYENSPLPHGSSLWCVRTIIPLGAAVLNDGHYLCELSFADCTSLRRGNEVPTISSIEACAQIGALIVAHFDPPVELVKRVGYLVKVRVFNAECKSFSVSQKAMLEVIVHDYTGKVIDLSCQLEVADRKIATASILVVERGGI